MEEIPSQARDIDNWITLSQAEVLLVTGFLWMACFSRCHPAKPRGKKGGATESG
jgi:hypothetical protein